MSDPLDAGVYPDTPPPAALSTDEEKADFVHRVLTAFDFGLVPTRGTLELLSGWKDVLDRFPLLSSPSYHALRTHFGWEEIERLPYFLEPAYVKMDRIEGREDGCEHLV